jgi:hypothetical protein
MKSARIIRSISLSTLAIACLCCASPTSAQAAPDRAPAAAKARPGSVLSLEIIDRAPSRRNQTVRLSVPVTSRGSSRVESNAGNADYKAEVQRTGSPDDPGPLRIELRRIDRRSHSESDAHRADIRLEVSVELQTGQRAVLARLERPDGSSTEVHASLR